MGHSPSNAGFPGRNAGFPGLPDGGTQRQSSEQPTAAPGTGSRQFSWSGVVPPQLEQIAMRENGFVLALWGGIGVAAGALLPFVHNVQIDGTPAATGSLINAGDRFMSLLFGLLLAGLALWTRYHPAFRRRIAIASLVVSLLGFVGYCLFILTGLADITIQTYNGPTQYSWDPSVGALLSIGGCAACAIAAIIMLRTRPPALSETS
jgi:drug/metabolite transporter (DMT)-like permease